MSVDKKGHVEQLETLDARIAQILEQKKGAAREELMSCYAKRGSLESDGGLAEAGLADLLRAYAQQNDLNVHADGQEFETLLAAYPETPPTVPSTPFWLWSRLGEGFRRYALDVLLARTDHPEDVYKAIHRSIDCFKRAEVAFEKGALGGMEKSKATLAWILAHRAAARTTLFWMSISASQPRNDLFEVAEREFRHAFELAPGYRWSRRFRAFLYALRGAAGDYRVARGELEAIRTDDPATQSSLNRSIAMLASYDAAPAPGESGPAPANAVREQAARDALDGAMAAASEDPEDAVALYFGAVATWLLGKVSRDEAARMRYAKRTSDAVEGARTRALSMISQGYAALAGLDLITAMTGDTAKTEAGREAGMALQRLSTIAPDWETRAIFMRDPVWQTAKNEKNAALLEKHESLNFDILRDKYKVWPASINPEDAK
jgi:hypothetical protein